VAKLTDVAVERPKLVVTVGRGKTGKSAFLRWVAETALATGTRPIRVFDADIHNATLKRCFDHAEAPPSLDDEDRRTWVEARLSEMVEAVASNDPFDAVLDLGGNDLLLKRLGFEVGLVELLDSSGVELVGVHMIGPDVADLRYLEDVERSGLFRPKRLVLVLNTGLVKTLQNPAVAFKPILESEIIRDVTSAARGGKLVSMPALMCMAEIEQKGLKSFSAAAAAPQVIGLFNTKRVAYWLERDMQAVRQQLAGYLP
jgi:hypothetical protein